MTDQAFDNDHIELKWGTLKAYNLESPVFEPLIDEYNEIGSSMSAMMQHDTPRQKEIICEMIDIIGKPVYLHWDGVEVSPEDAKKYVREYGTEAERTRTP